MTSDTFFARTKKVSKENAPPHSFLLALLIETGAAQLALCSALTALEQCSLTSCFVCDAQRSIRGGNKNRTIYVLVLNAVKPN